MFHNQHPPGSPPPYDPNAEQGRPKSPDKASECPECGFDLASADDRLRYKHAVMHYGDEPISRRGDQRLAAERKAAILGVKVEDVLT